MRKKLQRLAEIAVQDNVISPEKEKYKQLIGKWRALQFKNEYPIVLELACGRGEYTVGLAEVYPEKNFIGIDIKGDRIWVGSHLAVNKKLANVCFLRANIQLLGLFFAPREVNEIWITFPDPHPKKKSEKKRLTSDSFLDIYKNLLLPGSWVHLKTDNPQLFSYSLETIAKRDDIQILESTHSLYTSVYATLHNGIKTKYEKIFTEKGIVIKYLRFKFKQELHHTKE